MLKGSRDLDHRFRAATRDEQMLLHTHEAPQPCFTLGRIVERLSPSCEVPFGVERYAFSIRP